MTVKPYGGGRSLIDAVLAAHGIVFAGFVPERSLRRRIADGVVEKICNGVYIDALRSEDEKAQIVRRNAYAIACASSPSVILAGESAAAGSAAAPPRDTVFAVRAKPGAFSAYGVTFQFARAVDWHRALSVAIPPSRPGVAPVRKLCSLGICLAAGHFRAARVHQVDKQALQRLYLQAQADPAFPIEETVARLGLDFLCSSLLARLGAIPSSTRPALAAPEYSWEAYVAEGVTVRISGNGEIWMASGGACGGQHYVEEQLFARTSIPGLAWLEEHLPLESQGQPTVDSKLVGLPRPGPSTPTMLTEADSVLRAAFLSASSMAVEALIEGPAAVQQTRSAVSGRRSAIWLAPAERPGVFRRAAELGANGSGLAYEYCIGYASPQLRSETEMAIILTTELLAPHYDAQLLRDPGTGLTYVVELPVFPGRPDVSVSCNDLALLGKRVKGLVDRQDVCIALATSIIGKLLLNHTDHEPARSIGRVLPAGGIGDVRHLPLLGAAPVLGNRPTVDARLLHRLGALYERRPEAVDSAVASARQALIHSRFVAEQRQLGEAETRHWLQQREDQLSQVLACLAADYTPNRHHGPFASVAPVGTG